MIQICRSEIDTERWHCKRCLRLRTLAQPPSLFERTAQSQNREEEDETAAVSFCFATIGAPADLDSSKTNAWVGATEPMRSSHTQVVEDFRSMLIFKKIGSSQHGDDDKLDVAAARSG